nr:MAG TPA: hypothetical protein [Caudoviricetes sp.]
MTSHNRGRGRALPFPAFAARTRAGRVRAA